MDQMKAQFVRLRQQHIFAKMPFPMVPKRSLSSVNSSSPPSPSPSPTSKSTTSSSGIDEEIDMEIVEPISEFDQLFERINHQNGKTAMNKAKASAIKKQATKGNNNKNGGDDGQLKKQNIRWRPKRTIKSIMANAAMIPAYIDISRSPQKRPRQFDDNKQKKPPQINK